MATSEQPTRHDYLSPSSAPLVIADAIPMGVSGNGTKASGDECEWPPLEQILCKRRIRIPVRPDFSARCCSTFCCAIIRLERIFLLLIRGDRRSSLKRFRIRFPTRLCSVRCARNINLGMAFRPLRRGRVAVSLGYQHTRILLPMTPLGARDSLDAVIHCAERSISIRGLLEKASRSMLSAFANVFEFLPQTPSGLATFSTLLCGGRCRWPSLRRRFPGQLVSQRTNSISICFPPPRDIELRDALITACERAESESADMLASRTG